MMPRRLDSSTPLMPVESAWPRSSLGDLSGVTDASLHAHDDNDDDDDGEERTENKAFLPVAYRHADEDSLEDMAWDGRETPLDSTLERIGMGSYQWRLLVLCGFGWMTDNMWLQSIAVILPRVQVHFAVSDQWIGMLSASIFTGMMCGAWSWGSFSDSYGRRLPFNVTLVLTALCGFASAYAPSFGWLCFALFCLGLGVGGSMPTDGTLFLENIPRSRHYLLTALSFFFSVGAVIASCIGLSILPTASCKSDPEHDCNVEVENQGWRRMLMTLGTITFALSIARVLLFKLEESPKWLVAAKRDNEAATALRHITAFNSQPFEINLADVCDSQVCQDTLLETGGPSGRILSSRTASTSTVPPRMRRTLSKSSILSTKQVVSKWLIQWEQYSSRINELFSPQWAKTTILVWIIWTTVSFSYSCFNIFLPKFLEEKLGSTNPNDASLVDSLEDYLIYTIAGCPGSILGAWMIETRLGRRYSMALSTLVTALGTYIFVGVSTQTGVIASSMLISLMATLMYAVIYGYTPEVFPAGSRATACGIASALSRLSGIIAPLLVGTLREISTSIPLYISTIGFFVSAACMIALPIETRRSQN